MQKEKEKLKPVLPFLDDLLCSKDRLFPDEIDLKTTAMRSCNDFENRWSLLDIHYISLESV